MLIEIFYNNQSLKIAISKIINFVNNNFVIEVLITLLQNKMLEKSKTC